MIKLKAVVVGLVVLIGCLLIVGCSGTGDESNARVSAETLDLSTFPSALAERIATEESALEVDSEDAGALFNLGRVYHANRLYGKAEAVYIHYLNTGTGKEVSKAHYYLADIARNKGDLNKAIRHLEEVVSREKAYVPAYLSLGESFYKLNRVGEALLAYEKVLAADRSNPFAGIAIAREALERNDRDRAIEILETVVAAHPEFSEGLVLLAKLMDAKGIPERAAKLRIQNSRGWDLPPFDPWLEELVDFSFDVQGLGFLFEDFKRVGETERALSYLARMQEIDPSSATPHLLRGSLFYDQERRAEAESELSQAIRKGAPTEHAYPLLVKTLIEMGKLNAAEATALEALSIDPNIPILWVALGGLEIQRQNFEKAKDYLLKAYKLDPADGFVNRLLVDLYSRDNNLLDVVKHQQVLYALFPEDLELMVSLAKSFGELDQPDRAVELLNRAMGVKPNDSSIRAQLIVALENAGKLSFSQSDYETAIMYFSEAIRLGSASLELFGVKTQAHIRSGQLDEAEQTVKRVLSMYPDRAFFYSNLGDIQEANGKIGEARRSWSTALDLISDTDPPGLRQELESRLTVSPLD